MNKLRKNAIQLFCIGLIFLILSSQNLLIPAIGVTNTIRVPIDYPTIQMAVDAAVSGDIILVSPGTYYENVIISGKSITLASLYYETSNTQDIENTIIDGQAGATISIDANVGPDTTVNGFTIRNGADGIAAAARLNILNNHIISNTDGIDYSNSGGLCQGNLIENNGDDGIDFDDSTEALVENNTIRNNGEDGIEIRLHEYSGSLLTIIIRGNQIYGNGQDGIQLLDYPDLSDRVFYIERNLIRNNNRVGLGMMDNDETIEDYRAASIPERVHVFNNTFLGNDYAITGGDNLVAVNNIFTQSNTQGLKDVDGNSVVSHTIFWSNTTDQTGSNIDSLTTQYANPLLDASYQLLYGSPAIDAGTAFFEWQGQTVLDIPMGAYFDAAPDLGWWESNFSGQPTPTQTLTVNPTPSNEEILTFNIAEDSSIYSSSPTTNYGSLSNLEVDNSPLQNFLMKILVSGINGRQVTRATLRLYDVNGSDKGGDFYYVADNTWNESTVNWNNAPPIIPGILYSLQTVAMGNWYEVDLTSLIKTDGTYSLRVTSTSADGADYSSKESGNPPQLIVIVSGISNETPTATATHTFTPSIPDTTGTPTFTPTPTIPTSTPESIRFAMISDYGVDYVGNLDVSNLVHSWNVDFIVTAGDNSQDEAIQFDDSVGKYYHDFIYPYVGVYGAGATENRFWPALGNHDWDVGIPAYSNFFTLPNNERYYSIARGPVHFFILDSDDREPDGNFVSSVQAQWFKTEVAAAGEPWKIAVFHHPPYSSGLNGSDSDMEWGFENYGINAVVNGHDHDYERLSINGIPYFIIGLGGTSMRDFDTPIPGSVVRFNSDFGAMLVEADDCQITYQFITRQSILVDSYTEIKPDCLLTTKTPTNTQITPTNTLMTPTNTSIPQTNTPGPSPTPSNTPTASSTPVVMETITSQVNASSDDAEEETSSGWMYLNSGDLELGTDGSPQWVGMRFNNIAVPRGAAITNAYIEFEVDETGSMATSVIFVGQAGDHALTFTSSARNITSRPWTTAQVAWNDIPPWTVVNAKWQSPDLSSIISEIVSRPGWVSGNSIVIMVNGTGERTAESFEGEAPAAPKLVISYGASSTPTATSTALPPTATLTPTIVPPTLTNTPLPPSVTPTPTFITPTSTNTPIPPSATPTPTFVTPTSTNTAPPPSPTPTPTFITPTLTNTALPPSATPTPTSIPPTSTNTALPPSATPTPTSIPPTLTNTARPPSATPTSTFTQLPPTATFTQITPTPTATQTPPQHPNPIYLSLQNSGPTTVGNLSDVSGEDIIYFDGSSWSIIFDGSDVGLAGLVDAFTILSDNTILLSISRVTNFGPVGKVYPQDILRFTPSSLGENTAGTFSLYFDGSDVGLDKNQEIIKTIFQLPDGKLLISTKGAASVSGLRAAAEDLMVFTPTSLGENSSGTWALYFDGSDVGMTGDAGLDAVAVAANGDLYLSTAGVFSLGAVSGENEDVLVCTPIYLGDNTACTFHPNLYFDGSLWGLAGDNIDSIFLPHLQ